jgi:hypothetical protein
MEKKRLDSRVRFQHSNFTRKLHEARNYKRVARPRPDNRLQAGLEKVGLASLLAQLLLAAAVILAAYLLYVPNPLFVGTVRIEGLAGEYQALAQEAVKDYQSSQAWYAPKNNILFFNPNSLARAIAEKVPAISKIDSASKSFREKSVNISITQKYERYKVFRPDNELILYNDGTVKGQLPVKAGDLPASGALVTVSVNHTAPVNDGEAYFSPQFLYLIEQAATFFPERTGQNLAYFEVKLPADDSQMSSHFSDSWKDSGIVIVLDKKTDAGKPSPKLLRVIVEPGLDIPMAADRLKLLLAQTPPERYRSLYYIDLRLANRAYLCLISAPCANNNP